jgi:hypothetical protein
MHVETMHAGEPSWRLRYRPSDPRHDHHADRFEYRRLRACWNPGIGGPRHAYRPFVDWLARDFFRREPRVFAVRVRFSQLHVRDPADGGGVELTGESLWEERRRR